MITIVFKGTPRYASLYNLLNSMKLSNSMHIVVKNLTVLTFVLEKEPDALFGHHVCEYQQVQAVLLGHVHLPVPGATSPAHRHLSTRTGLSNHRVHLQTERE